MAKAKSKKKSVKRTVKVRRPAKRTVKKVSRKAVRKPARKVVRGSSRTIRHSVRASRSGSRSGSFGVKFTRRRYLREIRGPRGWQSSPGTTRLSDRRFATRKEAHHHGKRFTKIEGHRSFTVVRSSLPVNASINWRTGKTNPIIGLRRTNR